MTLRRKKSWFFGPSGSSYKKFSTNNEPTEQTFKELYDSQAWPAELNDTAKITEQGLSKIADDNNALDRRDANFALNEMTETTVPHHLPDVYSDIEGGAAYDIRDTDDADVAPGHFGYNPTEYVGWGIKVEHLKRTIGSIFRRVYRIVNTMTLASSSFSIKFTKSSTGYDVKIKPQSADGSITITDSGDGEWDFSGNPLSGPPGDSAIIVNKSSDIVLRGNASGTVTNFATAVVDLNVMQGGTKMDMTLFTAITSSPATNPATFEYSHSHPDNYTYRVSLSSINSSVDSGKITISFDIDGDPLHMVSIEINITKIKNNYSLEYQGSVMSLPGSSTHMYWYKLPNGSSWWFNDPNNDGIGIWVELVPSAGGGAPTETTTVTSAGTTKVLTSTSPPTQVIRGTTASLVAPVAFNTTGSFNDGQKFTFILKCQYISLNGQTFTLFGNAVTSAEAYYGDVVIVLIYDGTSMIWIPYREKTVSTSWRECLGFAHMTPTKRPQFKIVDNIVYFRGTAIVPLDNGAGVVMPYVNEIDYATMARTGLFLGSGGVTSPTNQVLKFNNSSPILPIEPTASPTVYKNHIITYGFRRVATDVPNVYATYHTIVGMVFATPGYLSLQTIRDTEYPDSYLLGSVDFNGNSGLRRQVSKATVGDICLDWTRIVGGTLDGVTAAAAIDLNIPASVPLHMVTIDGADASTLGGFEFSLANKIMYLD